MGKPFPYFRFYPRDYFEATRVLTLEERGAYMDIICLEMMLEGVLRDDDDLLSHHLHISKRKWRPLKAALVAHGKLSVEDGMIVNDRCVRELAALMDERRNRSDAAASREKERKNGSPVRGRVRAEPTPKAAKKSKEINESGTTTVAQRQNTGNPVVDDLLNAVQTRFDADSALTHARVGVEPTPNVGKKSNEINETETTVVPLRARVTDTDIDKKGEERERALLGLGSDVTPPKGVSNGDAKLASALAATRERNLAAPVPEPHPYWLTELGLMEAAKSVEEARMQVNVWRNDFGGVEIADKYRDNLRKTYSDNIIDGALDRVAGKVNGKSTAVCIAMKIREYCTYTKQDADKNSAIAYNIANAKQSKPFATTSSGRRIAN